VNKQKSRRVFDTSFKLQVAQMVKVQGLSISQVCKDMKIGESAVRRWIAQFEAEQLGRAALANPSPLSTNASGNWRLRTTNCEAMSTY